MQGRATIRGAPPEVVVPSRRGAPAERLLRRLAGPGAPEQIVLLDLDEATAPSAAWASTFTAETAWLESLRRELDAGATPFVEAMAERITLAGYRVRVFRADGRPTPASSRGG